MLDSLPDLVFEIPTTFNKLTHLSKIGKQNRFPSDPMMLNLCSWKQEQFEGVGIVTLIVEEIIRKLEIKLEKVIIVKTGLYDSVSPGEVVETRVWEQDGSYGENYVQVFFESAIRSNGRPIINGRNVSLI